MKSWIVRQVDQGKKLVAFLHEKTGKKVSSRRLKAAIEQNLCRVNGAVERFASSRLRVGDTVELDEGSVEELSAKRFGIEIKRVLYEDDALLFYDKPAGLSSDKSGLGRLFPELLLVHRLDKETSGVIMLAKSQEVRESLIAMFRKFEVGKVYLALVDGRMPDDSGLIKEPIGRISTDANLPLWGVVAPDKGKSAITRWELAQQGKSAALLRCYPQTGRTHQIRVHLKSIGHPLLGDYRYARKYRCAYRARRCMLHALSLRFNHPLTGHPIRVEAPVPDDFTHAMEKVLK